MVHFTQYNHCYYCELAHLLILGILHNNIDRINVTSTEHWRVISKLDESQQSHVFNFIIPNNEYGKYYPGAAARPEYGSVFRVSLPFTGLLSSWSLDNICYL